MCILYIIMLFCCPQADSIQQIYPKTNKTKLTHSNLFNPLLKLWVLETQSWGRELNTSTPGFYYLKTITKPSQSSHSCFSQVKIVQSCLTLCDPMDYTVHGIFQARILEWVACSLLQGIFLSQESNWGLLHCRHGEGNGTPLQYSYLENPMDWGAW